MLAEFRILPLGTGESVGTKVSKLIGMIDASGLPYKAGPMGTTVEGTFDEVMALIKRCHTEALHMAPRVITSISIDDRPGRPMDRLSAKLDKVEDSLGRKIKR